MRLEGRCPVCLQHTWIRQDGVTMSRHWSDQYRPATASRRRNTVREECPFGGGTLADARAGITPLDRRRMNREAEQEAK